MDAAARRPSVIDVGSGDLRRRRSMEGRRAGRLAERHGLRRLPLRRGSRARDPHGGGHARQAAVLHVPGLAEQPSAATSTSVVCRRPLPAGPVADDHQRHELISGRGDEERHGRAQGGGHVERHPSSLQRRQVRASGRGWVGEWVGGHAGIACVQRFTRTDPRCLF